MSLGTIRLALTVFAVFMVYLVPAQLKQQEQSLIIRGKTIPLAENAVAWLDSVAKAETSGPIQVLLHFYQLPDEGVKRRLAASGVDLLDYLPQNAYTAILNLPLKDLDPAATFLRSIRPLSPEWKMDERLLQSLRKRGSGNITVLVSFVRGTVTAKAGMILGQLGGRVTDDRFAPVSSFVAELPAAAVDQLAALPLVRYMGLPALPEPLNFDARSSSGANLLGSPAATGGVSPRW